MQRLGSFPLHCGFSCAFFCNAVNARQVGATALVRFRCIVDSVVRFCCSERTPVGPTAWFVSAALWIQLCVFLQRSERTPGRCNGLVRFRCIVDSVVRFLQRSERTPGRCNGFGSFPLHCGFSCAFLRRSERTPGRCNGFGSFPLHCGFSCAFFCNAVNARQVGATALVRFRCIVDSVVRFFATQ